MTAAPERTAGLRAARAQDSADKRRRALATIHALEAAGTPITVSAVANAAGIDLARLHRRRARAPRRRAAPPSRTRHPRLHRRTRRPGAAHPGRPAHRPRPGPRRDPPAARRTRQVRHRLRLQLGAEIDRPDRAELITRVAELESLTRQLLAERDARTAEADHAQRRIHELEDDLTAARESLRRFIKDHNRP